VLSVEVLSPTATVSFPQDIGGNIGMFAITTLLRYPKARVVTVEPLHRNRVFLKYNAKKHAVDDRLTILPYAINRWFYNGFECRFLHSLMISSPSYEFRTFAVPNMLVFLVDILCMKQRRHGITADGRTVLIKYYENNPASSRAPKGDELGDPYIERVPTRSLQVRCP
jgi:hypothetical protein